MRKWILGFTSLFLILLAFNIWPVLRGGWGWRWFYRRPDNWEAVFILIALLLIYLLGVYILRRRQSNTWLALSWSILAGLCLSLAVQNTRHDPFFLLFSHTVSPVQTGASRVAVLYMSEDGLGETLKSWPSVMREAREKTITHFTTSPPGQAIAHYWLAEATDSLTPISLPISSALRAYQCSNLEVMKYSRGELVSAGIGALMPLWATLALIPIFFIVKNLSQDRQLAIKLAQWWPLVPSMLMFAPSWSIFYPLVIMAAFAVLLKGLQKQHLSLVLLSGFILSIGTFLNFAFLPIPFLFGLYIVGYWYFILRQSNPAPTWHYLVWNGLCLALGLSSLWILFGLYTGYTPLDILRTSFEQHFDIQQNYLIDLGLHTYDVLMFAGWPLTLSALVGAYYTLKRLIQRAPLSELDIFTLAFLITVAILLLSGTARRETARVWLFLIPFLLIRTAPIFQNGQWWDMPLLVAQAASVAVMASVLYVMPLDMNPPPEAPRNDTPQLSFAEIQPVEWVFSSEKYAGRFELSGYRFVADPSAQTLTVELVWQGDVPTERPYQFELVAYAENEIDGQIISAPFMWYPQAGNYLSSCWQKGDMVHDVVVMPLPPVSQPVVWTLALQAYDERTGDIALINASNSSVENLMLGPIKYP